MKKQHTKVSLLFVAIPMVCCFSCARANSPITPIDPTPVPQPQPEPGPTPTEHTHTFADTYSYNGTDHWQVATCEHTELTQNYGKHVYEDGLCTVCGYPEPIIYDEEEDSTEGIDVEDLSHLYNAFSNIGENYTLDNQSHFTDGALNLYKHDYNAELSQNTTRMFNEKYCYTYSNIDAYKSLPEYNKVYFIDGENITYAIADNNLLEATTFLGNIQENDGKFPFKLSKINENYFATYIFKRVSKNKYICEHDDVINDMLNLCCPYLQNEGYYMTYKKASFELDDEDKLTRIRIYASPTQIGKLTPNYKNQEYKNWYLLFNETTVRDIGNTIINCLEK